MLSGSWWSRGGEIGGDLGLTKVCILGYGLFPTSTLNFADQGSERPGNSSIVTAWLAGENFSHDWGHLSVPVGLVTKLVLLLALRPLPWEIWHQNIHRTWLWCETIYLCWTSAQSEYLFDFFFPLLGLPLFCVISHRFLPLVFIFNTATPRYLQLGCYPEYSPQELWPLESGSSACYRWGCDQGGGRYCLEACG